MAAHAGYIGPGLTLWLRFKGEVTTRESGSRHLHLQGRVGANGVIRFLIQYNIVLLDYIRLYILDHLNVIVNFVIVFEVCSVHDDSWPPLNRAKSQ